MRLFGRALTLLVLVVGCSAPLPPAPTSVPPSNVPTVVAPTAMPPQQQAITPTCPTERDRQPTVAQTEGPFFKAGSPERTSLLEPGMPGARVKLSGFVLDTGCRPISRAKLDFWQADDAGNYDNSGFRLRGHQFTDASGRYTLQTIVPALYTGRTRHIHVKVQAPNGPLITTQLYFAGQARNQTDSIFNDALQVELKDAADGGKSAAFNFVVRAS